MWATSSLKPKIFKYLTKFQKINQFPRSVELTRKDCLALRIASMQEKHSRSSFNFLPKTFVLPRDYGLCKVAMDSESRFWIVKPSGSS